MLSISKLELHVTHACNLACDSCTHYTNQGHKGNLALQDADAWMRPWAGRLRPGDINLLGGEPTIHAELPAFVRLTRHHFPETRIRVVTNGFFLDRQPALPEALAAVGNAQLDISIHHGSWRYGALLGTNLQLAQEWARTHGIRVTMRESFDDWKKQYHGLGANMAPFTDGDPRASWQHCKSRDCTQLFEGQLWKCPPLAYLPMQHAKYGLSAQWQPYLRYQPLSPDCSDEALQAFFQAEDESYCSMCPAHPVTYSKPWPLPGPATR